MRNIGYVLGLCAGLCYAGFSSGNSWSESAVLNDRYTKIPPSSKGNALGWLEIKKETQERIEIEVLASRFLRIEPIWNFHKDEDTSLSAFGIVNQSSFDVVLNITKSPLAFSSIASGNSGSLVSGIFQNKDSVLKINGDLKFSSIAHQGIRGSSFGVLGGRVEILGNGVVFENIDSQHHDSYGALGKLDVENEAILRFEKINAGLNAFGIVGDLYNKGETRFGEIIGGDHFLQYQGQAYGIKGNIQNAKLLQFSLIKARGSVYGVSGEMINNGEIIIKKIHSLEGNAYGMVGNIGGVGNVQIQEILAGSLSAGGNAYGIFNLDGLKITNNIHFSSMSAIKDFQNKGGEVFGIYTLGDLQIKDSNIVFSSMQGDKIYPLYVGGLFEIEDSSLIFGGKEANALLSLDGGEVILNQAILDSKERIGIYANQATTLKIIEGGDVRINAPKCIDGEMEIVLESGARLSLGSDAKINILRAKDGATLEIASNSATLQIQDFQANNANFILTSTLKTSDKIVIQSTSSTQPLKNNLYVKLYEVSAVPNYVLLVSMPKELGEKIVFNELAESSAQSRSTSYVGFDEVEVEIKRYDTNEKVYYYSDLVAKNVQINPNILIPTQIALNANHSLFLLNNDSMDLRMGELRGGIEGSGIWGKLNIARGIEKMQKSSSIEYFSLQAGYDYDFLLLDASNFLGFFGGYIRGVNTQEGGEYENITVSLDSYEVITQGFEVGVYNSYVREKGLFLDSVAKMGAYFSKAQMPYEISSNRLDTYAFSLSQEIGYRFVPIEGFSLDLQSDIGASYLSAQDFLQTLEIDGVEYSLDSRQKALWVIKNKSGMTLGYQWKKENFSLGVNIGGFYAFHSFFGGSREFLTSSNTTVSNNPYTHNHQGILNIGVNLAIKERSRLFLDFEKSFGGKLLKDFSLNFGARFALGKIPSKEKPQEEGGALEILN